MSETVVKIVVESGSKIGLKLWSSNTGAYLQEAARLYQDNVFDFIELYVVPKTLDSIEKWAELQKNFGIPFNLHAPHFAHDINLAKKEYEAVNFKVYDEVKQFSQSLNPELIVVHSGMDGDINETIRQLKIIKLDKMVIENKPYKAPINVKALCRGATVEEIKKVMDNIGCGFCLDVSHAISAANSFGVDPYGFFEEFNSLKPSYYHICDGNINSDIDCHLNFGRGDYDFKKIFSLINKDKMVAIETRKSSKENLNDFVEDANFVKSCYEV